MIVCPVCEHSQPDGVDCEVCGKRLLAGAAAARLTSLPLVEGLEPTLHAAVDAGTERILDLEPTRHAAAATTPYDRVPDIEPTRAGDVDVDVTPAPDLVPTTIGTSGDAPAAVSATIACRYCRSPAAPGERICARCGMRLPIFGTRPADAADGMRTCSCGTLVRGAACPSCGARR